MKEFKDFEINLFGDVWKVKFVEGWLKQDDGNGGENWYLGLTYHSDRHIEVSISDDDKNKRSKDEIMNTLCHELMHAFNGCGQYLQGDYEVCNSEPYVEWIGKCIAQLLKLKI